jgi:hypothetical protein
MLVLETPLDDKESMKIKVLTYMDYVVTGLFTIEMILKVIASGFACNGKQSYLRNTWNIADFFIVVISLI